MAARNPMVTVASCPSMSGVAAAERDDERKAADASPVTTCPKPDSGRQLLSPSTSLDARPTTPSHTSLPVSPIAADGRRQSVGKRPAPRSEGRSEEIGQIGLHWMRVNGAFQQFRTLLSSAAKGVVNTDSRPSGARREDPGVALINFESATFPKYTEEGGATGSRPPKSSPVPGTVSSSQKTVITSRLVRRKDLYEKRKKSSDYALFFALLGIVLMIIENELSAAEFYDKSSGPSYVLKSLILCSTLVLLALIAHFHVIEIQLFMNDNSAEDWRIGMTDGRLSQILLEIAICAVCPVPGNFHFSWTTIHADGATVTTTQVSLDVLLSIPMFLRLYLIGRVMLLHSRLFTDASSRSIGALNRVHFNARFVLKTLMTLCPGTVLLVFTASLWIIAGWILRLCERYHTGDPPSIPALKHQNYLNSLWMIAITFLSVGYGDIVPNTYCGRAVAVITGIMGAGTASMVVAVIARKLELSRAEKHVHTFMMDTQLSKRLKHAAANVLRETWLIYKNRRLVDKIDPGRIRLHQRKFLMAIYELRKIRRDQRKLAENAMTVSDIIKTSTTTFEMVSDMHGWQEGLETRLGALEEQMQLMRTEIQQVVRLVSAQQQPPLRPAGQRLLSDDASSPD